MKSLGWQGAIERVLVVFIKEVIDNLRDRRTLLTALITPLTGPLILAFTIVLAGQFVASENDKSLRLPVKGVENAPQLVAFLESQPNVEVRSVPNLSEADVQTGLYDVALVIPRNYAADLRSGRPASIQLIADSSRQTATGTLIRTRGLISAYSRQIGSLRLLARGINPSILQALAVENVDVASSQGRVAAILGVMPIYLLLAAFVGGFYVAIDTTTGERERGSLEPLVINPVARRELIFGKLAATITFTVVVVTETLVALAVMFNFVPLDALGIKFSFEPFTFVNLFLLTLPIVLLASASLMIIASFTRSFKEAQSYLTPLFLIPTFPSLLVTFLPLKLEWWSALIPIYSQQLLMSQVIKGEPVNGSLAILSSVVTLAIGLLLVWIATRLFDAESVV